MTSFAGPVDITFNRGAVTDPQAFARDAGDEFAAMDGGLSYAEVQASVPESVNIVSDPPRVMDMPWPDGTWPPSTNSPAPR